VTADANGFWMRSKPIKIRLCEIPDGLEDPDEIEFRIREAASQMYIDLHCYNIEISEGQTRYILSGKIVWAVRRPVHNVVDSL